MVCDKVRQVEGLKGWRRISRDTENGKKSRHSMRNSNKRYYSYPSRVISILNLRTSLLFLFLPVLHTGT